MDAGDSVARVRFSRAAPAYLRWWLVQMDLADLLDSAIASDINTFKGHPQCLGQLAARGLINIWQPSSSPEWWEPLSSGTAFPREWALIVRPSTNTERPAKWYIDDGSGRALALLRRMLTHQGTWRCAWAYLGIIPDAQATFMRTRPELLALD